MSTTDSTTWYSQPRLEMNIYSTSCTIAKVREASLTIKAKSNVAFRKIIFLGHIIRQCPLQPLTKNCTGSSEAKGQSKTQKYVPFGFDGLLPGIRTQLDHVVAAAALGKADEN